MTERDMIGRKKVLFACGSLREKSLNKQVGEKVIEFIGDAVDTAWLRYDDLPYMNQDIEFPVPEAVQRVRDEVAAANALWICSPEYNHGIPGVLKNCIDWLSRPVTPGSVETTLKDKLITFTCAAGGSVGRYAAAALAETLSFVSSSTLLTMHAQVALDRQDYTTDVLTLSAEEEKALQAQVRLLLQRLSLSTNLLP